MGETMRKEKKGKKAKSTGWNKFFVVLTMIFTLNYLVWRIFFTMPQLQQTQQLFLCGFTVVAFMNAHSDGVQPRLAHYSSRHGGVGQPDAENFAAAEHRLLFIRNANHRGRHIAHQNHLSHHFRFIGKQLPTGIAVEHYHLCPTVELQFIEGITFAKGHAVDIKILRTDPLRAGGNVNIVGAQAQAF